MNKVVTMSFHEFFSSEEINELERAAKLIRRNKQLENVVVALIGSLLFAQNVMAKDLNTKALDAKGMMILIIIRKVGYWACIILCSIEVIRALMQGDTKSITKIVSKYIIGFASLYFVPWIFDFVRDLFS